MKTQSWQSFLRVLAVTLVPAALLLTTPACGDDDDDNGAAGASNGGAAGTSTGGAGAGTGGSSGASGAAGSAAGATQAQSDAQLAGVLSVINTGEINQGKVADSKGLRDDVVAYGTMMDTMHTDNQSKLLAILANKGVTLSEDSSEAEQTKSKGDAVMTQLSSDPAMSTAFDTDYIQSQIDGHTNALNLIDTVLLVKVTDTELKAHFTMTRADVVMHLSKANELKSGAGGAGGAGGMSDAAGMAGMSGAAGTGSGGAGQAGSP